MRPFKFLNIYDVFTVQEELSSPISAPYMVHDHAFRIIITQQPSSRGHTLYATESRDWSSVTFVLETISSTMCHLNKTVLI